MFRWVAFSFSSLIEVFISISVKYVYVYVFSHIHFIFNKLPATFSDASSTSAYVHTSTT